METGADVVFGVPTRGIKIMSGNAHPALAAEIAGLLGMRTIRAEVQAFSDGEVGVEIFESVRGIDIFVVQSTCAPINDTLMELLIMIDACRRASAGRIIAVIPYLGYSRRDAKTRARDPITAKLVSNMVTRAGADRVLAVDFHSKQIQGFFDIPADNINFIPSMARFLALRELGPEAVVVSPDMAGTTRARDLASRLGLPLAIIDKRPGSRHQEDVMVIGEVEGRTAIIIDDIIDTGTRVSISARALKEAKARQVIACCTHAVLSGTAVTRLGEAPLKEIIVTNTIPLTENKRDERITVLSVAPIICEAILKVHGDGKEGPVRVMVPTPRI